MKRYIIQDKDSIKDALVALNQISSDTQSLLVVDEEQKMVGTLTDGDIRRGLISGAELADSVSVVMHKDFKYVIESEFDVAHLKTFRDKHIFFIPVLDAERRIVDVVNLKKHKSHLPIDAVLMAGGKGERLRPLTEKTPKPLLKVGDKCIIDHNVDRLMAYGINHVNVTVNYLGEQLEAHYSEYRNGVKVRTFREPEYLGTIGSIKFVDGFYNDTILVMNSDLFTNIDYEAFYLHFKKHDADMSVVSIPYTIKIPYGIFQIDGRRDITDVIEKPSYEYHANAGIYLIKKSVLDLIPGDRMFHSTDLMMKLIENGKKVIRFPHNGTWIDIGSPQEYERANVIVNNMY